MNVWGKEGLTHSQAYKGGMNQGHNVNRNIDLVGSSVAGTLERANWIARDKAAAAVEVTADNVGGMVQNVKTGVREVCLLRAMAHDVNLVMINTLGISQTELQKMASGTGDSDKDAYVAAGSKESS